MNAAAENRYVSQGTTAWSLQEVSTQSRLTEANRQAVIKTNHVDMREHVSQRAPSWTMSEPGTK